MGLYWLYYMIKTNSILDLFTFGFIGISLFFIGGITLAILKEGQNG
jgi:hypothetical protein